jgi:tellurite resistance protein TehA-like permease
MPIERLPEASPRFTVWRLVADLPGGCFAFVMATGIVSIAAAMQGLDAAAAGLFGINIVGFAILTLLTLVRLIWYPAALLAELSHHRRGPAFLTVVAATGVLGNEFALQTAYQEVATALWIAACGLWVLLVYALLIALTIKPAKPPIATGLDGTWLLIVVASEALSILGTHVAGEFRRPDDIVFISLCGFLLGGFFYLLIISLILYRWLFQPLPPQHLTPPYWINMGAVAIATLAGARLGPALAQYPVLTGFAPAVAALTTAFWAVASWWIPLLAALMIWRHAVGRVPLSYRLEYWAMVFPLGMYAAATWTFSHQEGLEFLYFIARVFAGIAAAAWLATLVGMIHRALRRL